MVSISSIKRRTKMKIKVSNIKYEIDGLGGFDPELEGKTREEFLSSLPQSMKIDLDNDLYEWGVRYHGSIEQYIKQMINYQTMTIVVGFDFVFLGQSRTFVDEKGLNLLNRMREIIRTTPIEEVA